MALTCSNCGKALPDDAKFCGDCGTTVDVQENKPDCCANCFAELPEGVKFCLQCGKPAVIAKPDHPRTERDEALYEELYKTSPRQVKQQRRDAVYQATGKYTVEDDTVEDFEQNRAIIAARAMKWAEYETNNMERIHWFQDFYHWGSFEINKEGSFSIEKDLFPTNKPNHHKALFFEENIKYYLFRLRRHGVLTWDDPPQTAPLFFDYLRNVLGFTDERIKEIESRLPDAWSLPKTFNVKEVSGWAAKDDELFPPPQPQRVEVAGAILNFTTDEGVLVVYTDCAHKGKTVEVNKFSESSVDYPDRITEIRERTIGNTVLCAAIFNHIPFVNNRLRHDQKVLTKMDCTVKASYSANLETVTLYRGQVTELDWRGRK